MSKTDEFFSRRIEHSVELGKANAEHIRNMQNWCKHFRVVMESAGLIAEMYHLPVGLHRLSCPYVDREIGSSNLPWVIPNFLIENCANCTHHEGNGSTSWGEQIIEGHKRRLQERHEAEQAQQERLRQIRERIRELPRQARDTSQMDERQILIFIENLFSDDESQRVESARHLVQSARIGSELFSPIAVDILLDQSMSEDFGTSCLPVCAELAGRRTDLTERLKGTALSAIERRVYPELAAQVLFRLGDEVQYPLETALVKNLIRHQHHVMPIGGWAGEPPDYPTATRILLRCYDADPTSVIVPFRSLLQINNKYARIHACGALALIQKQRPQIGLDLLADLVCSFELDDDPYQDSADEKTAGRIVAAFRYTPQHVDEYLASQMQQRRPAVQGEIVGVYRKLMHNQGWHIPSTEPQNDNALIETEISIARCLEFVKDDSVDVEVRYEAAEALHVACGNYPNTVLTHFDSILGYYAILCTQPDPPPLPKRIFLPGEDADDPVMANLNEAGRRQKWTYLNRKLLDCMKELAQNQPTKLGEVAINCFRQLDTATHTAFKSAIVNLLGDVGKDYALQPRVMPLLMQALMDYGSQQVRASAIKAVREMYRHSNSGPPRNVLDVILVHLRDTYVIVHVAAIDAIDWMSRWLSKTQAVEALTVLLGVLRAYEDDPFQTKDICRTLFAIARYHPELKQYALGIAASVFPTKQQLVDQAILGDMLRCVKPDNRAAEIVARHATWCLSQYSRDRYNSYDYSARARAFEWLLGIPKSLYAKIRDTLFEAAQQLATKDAWESFHFAALFSQFGDYEAEKAVFTAASAALPAEQRYDSFRSELGNLSALAEANCYLCKGEAEAARQMMDTIQEIPDNVA